MAEARSKWPLRATAAAMVAHWVLFLILNQRWLSASVEYCGPDSAPECGMFNIFPELIYGSGTVLSVVGVAVALWILADRSAPLAVGALLHLATLCLLGLPISGAPISHGTQVFWGWIFGLANFALMCVLFSFLAAPRLPELPHE